MQPDFSTTGSVVYLDVFDSNPSVGFRNTNTVKDEVVSCGIIISKEEPS